MSGLWRKTLVYLGLIEEPEEELPEEYVAAPAAKAPASGTPSPSGITPLATETAATADTSNVTPLRPGSSARPDPGGAHVRPVSAHAARVHVCRAASFGDAEQVGSRYRTGQPVLLDLRDVEPKIGRRLLDFVSGTIYALRGRIVEMGGKAFLLVPEGAEVSNDERRRLADLGYRGDE